MNPKKLNTIQLITTFLGLFISFTFVVTSNYWIIWALLFVVFLVLTFIVLDRRENLRKGWRV